jgi:splicing factor U2AF subunit
LKEALKHFEQFYEEIFLELADFGELKDLSVVDNLGDHLIGNVYARYNDEESAEKAFNALAGKYYHSSLVQEEYSPIISMKDCICRKYEEGICIRGAFCNFLHLKEVNKSLLRSLKDEMYETHPEYKKNRKNNLNEKKARKHENSSSESSLDKYDNFKRKKIIRKWNEDFMTEKKNNDKKKKIDQTKIDLAILEKKLRNKQFEEDLKKNEQKKKKSEKEKKVDSDDEETITNEEGNK